MRRRKRETGKGRQETGDGKRETGIRKEGKGFVIVLRSTAFAMNLTTAEDNDYSQFTNNQ